MNNVYFDNDKYLALQTEKILERIELFDNKLYLEFGGKLFDDNHASRVLPGFLPDTKIKMLSQLKEHVEILITINAQDIEKNKMRGDIGITYDQEVLRLIDAYRGIDLYVGGVVIGQYSQQPSADAFKNNLQKMGVPVYLHYPIVGYPTNLDAVISEEGFGKNDYVKTTRPLVISTAPGPGSGKMATCLSQLYHDHKHGIKSGYSKFETFPIWNLPLKHPVNLAYEAATADLNDINMIDPFHMEAYGEVAVNYNRDVEAFPVLNAMLKSILNESPYKSPTDMGVNMAGFCFIDDEGIKQASRHEIIYRYYNTLVLIRKGHLDESCASKIEFLMTQAEATIDQRKAIAAATLKAEETNAPAVAIELEDGTIVTGKTSKLFGACASCLLNTLKVLANISDRFPLISHKVIEPIQTLKVDMLGNNNPRLHSDEMLIMLSVAASTNPAAELAIQQLKNLKGARVHSTVILSYVDEEIFKKLGMTVTMTPVYHTKKLYHKK